MFALLCPALAARWQFWPFALGLVFLGLPHGALDHLAPLFLLGKRLTLRYLALFVAAYAGLVLLYLVFWHVAPLLALAVFLVCSWLHWGQGDAYYLAAFGDQPRPRTVWGRGLVWAVRGGLPILLPPLAHPAALAQVAGGMLAWYGGHGDWALTPSLRGIGLGLLGLALLAYLRQSWTLSKPAFRQDAGEIALLTVYFLAVPSVLAVGVYFAVWHSARHIARLMLLDPADRAALASGQIGRCAVRSARQALPMTLGALCFLAGLWAWQGHTHTNHVHTDLGGFVYLYLSLIAALTFPHFLLVLWMDRQEFGDPL